MAAAATVSDLAPGKTAASPALRSSERGSAASIVWLRVDAGPGQVSDAFRVRLGEDREALVVQDLKEQVLEQAPEVFHSLGYPANSLPSPPWLFIELPARGGKAGELGTGELLSASASLGSLPAAAGGPEWPFTLRVTKPRGAVPAAAAAAPKREPRTLFEKGIAAAEEHPQIRNATDLSELYPGGKLPTTGPSKFDTPEMVKLALVFVIMIAFMAGGMYFLGSVLPTLLPPSRPVDSESLMRVRSGYLPPQGKVPAGPARTHSPPPLLEPVSSPASESSSTLDMADAGDGALRTEL